MAVAVASCYAAIPAVAQQLPSNPVVTNGSASFSQTGKTLNVTNSNGAIIQWNSFSIGAGYTTNFNQPSASSSVLNRVVGASPSAIYGTLSSNGKVWLINPNGIVIGPGGMVNTAAFVASTLSVSDADFLAGRLSFQLTPGAGSVVNQGTITTPSGGSVYLIGSNVSNEGLVTTPNGETILAAGETVNLVDTGTPGVKVEITGAAGNTTNLGEILAEAGQIGMAGVIVRNSGTLNASSVVNEGGRIFLRANQDAYVDGSGRIVATGTKGGSVEVLGDRVAVMDQAQIDASGTNGGGTVLVGGDYQGKNPDVRNASITYFGPDASIRADATDSGDGGKVVVWSDETTRAYGTISARGGANGGDGGSVETSGRQYLDFQATVDMRATSGRAGTLLLDPSDIVIDNTDSYGTGTFSGGVFYNASLAPSHLSWGTITGQLALGSLVIETNGSNGSGDITVNAAGVYSSPNTLTLLANRNIAINQGAGIGNNDTSGTGGINLIAGWNNTGWMVAPGTGDILIDRANISANAAVTLTAGHDITITGDTVGSPTYSSFGRVIGKTVSVNAGNNISVSALGVNDQAYIGFESMATGASMDLTAGGTITLQSSGLTNQNNVHIMSAGNLSINASRLVLNAGTAGHDNKAYIESYGAQTINLSYGGGTSLVLQGGGGTGSYNDFAAIFQKSATGSQSFTLNGGTLSLQGGAGDGTGGNAFNATECGVACSGNAGYNAAVIHNAGSGGQSINFTNSGGAITLTGGTVGNGNFAVIRSDGGTQSITGSNSSFYPTVMLTGGTTGGLSVPNPWGGSYLSNHASIFSQSGPQQIYATQISLDGGAGSGIGGAAILAAAGNQTIVDSNVLSLTGGTGSYSHAAIRAWSGDQTITASRVTLHGGAAGHDNGAYITDNGNQSVTVTGSGAFALELYGGGGAGGYGNVAEIGQWGSAGSQRITLASTTASTLTLAGGSGNGTGWSNSDCVTAGLSGCSMSGNHALIHNEGYNATYGAQTVAFNGNNGTLSITGGTLGTNNDARIENGTYAGAQNISGTGLAVSLTGGASGGKAMLNNLYGNDIEFENSAWVESKGTQSINVGSISMVGGGTSTTFGGAGITGKSGQNITTSGNLTMQGGGGVYGSGIVASGLIATPVIIGEKNGEPIVLNVGGTLSVTGGAGYGSEAMIGALLGSANVTINAYGGMSFSGGGSSAILGTVAGSGGTVSLKSGYASGVYNAGIANMIFSSGTYVRTGQGIGSINLATYGTNSHIAEATGPVGSGMTTGTLNMVATNSGGHIDMVGPNYASSVYASATGNGTIGVRYYTDLSFTHVAATAASGSVEIYSNAANTPSGGDIGLGLLSGPGSVMVQARGAIVDDNGYGVLNVSGSAISLHSTNGNTWGGIAISADVNVLSGGTLGASVAGTAAVGGIRISNVGAYEPTSTSLTDASTTAGYGWVNYSTVNNLSTATAYNLSSASSGVSLYSSGTVTLTNLSTFIPSTNNNYGYIDIWGNAGMTVTNAGSTSSNLMLGTSGNMTITGALGANSLGLFAGGTLTATNASIAALSGLDMWALGGLYLVGSTVTSSNGDIYLGSADMKLMAVGTGFSTGGGDVSLDGSSVSASNGGIYVATSGDVRLNRGSSLSSRYNDLALLGSDSTLYLDDTAGRAASRINSVSSLYVDFPQRSTGGIVIDGVATTTTGAGSGFFVNGAAAVLGAGSNLHYGIAPPVAATSTAAVLSSLTTVGSATPTSTSTPANIPPPTSATSGGGSPGSLGTESIGGSAGTFGGGDTTTTTNSGTTGSTLGGTGDSGTTLSTGGGSGSSSSSTDSGGDAGSGSKEARSDSKKTGESREGDKSEDKPHHQRVGKCAA